MAPEVCFEPISFFAELGKRGIQVNIDNSLVNINNSL
jgi:hypothetical protein